MNRLIRLLDGHSLVVANGNDTRVFDGRGISDLYRLVTGDDAALLSGATVVDKVVGKGAAALMILGDVKRLHAVTISKAALNLLSNSKITVTYDKVTDAIINRAGTGPCPVESLCADCHTAAECLPLINKFVTQTAKNQ